MSGSTFASARSRACAARADIRCETEPVHAGVDLQPYAQRARVVIGFEPAQLRFMMNDGIQAEPAEFGKVGRLVRPGQHDDAFGDARRTQAQAVAERGDAEGIGIAERARNAFQTMAIAIGLDHRHHLRGAGALAHAREVAAQSTQMNRRQCGAAHCVIAARFEAVFSKRVYRPRKVSLTVPVGPLRCLPMMISARPLSADSLS